MNLLARAPGRLLISGVPACGKTKFSRWLVRNHGYRRFNVDEGDDLNQAMKATGKVVIEYGFPPDVALQLITNLVKHGFTAWWFSSANYPVALRAFQTRENRKPVGERIDVTCFYLRLARSCRTGRR